MYHYPSTEPSWAKNSKELKKKTHHIYFEVIADSHAVVRNGPFSFANFPYIIIVPYLNQEINIDIVHPLI